MLRRFFHKAAKQTQSATQRHHLPLLLSRQFSATAAATQSPRGESRAPIQDLSLGDTSHNFTLEAKDYFSDYDITLLRFRHQRLGTVHYHIDCPDKNNAFAFNFTTLPDDDTGKPHILEHITLCGSEKYPVRDPFFNMLKRSLSTFMNAWTGPDFTSYPFSTTNETDFYNLLSVYAESTMKPNLNKNDFLQEGWRLEFEDPNDPTTPLQYKGVVYNEMKGVYENPKNIFVELMQKALLAGTPYENNSGGDPVAIPKLTYQQLKDFHAKNYHPSNASIFTYGDLSPLKHQEFLEENYFADFEPGVRRTIENAPTIEAPVRLRRTKPVNVQTIEEGKDNTYGIGFLCNTLGEDISDSLGLSILSYLMFHTPKSPFYVEFLEAGLAGGYCPGVGYESTLKNSTFVIGFDDVSPEEVDDVLIKIYKTLNQIAENGFEEKMIEGALHLIESNAKIAKSNFGLNLFMNLMGSVNHESLETIKKSLEVTENIEEIRAKMGQDYFQNLVRKYFLKNERRVHLKVFPDPLYLDMKLKIEKRALEKISANLTEDDIERIVQEAKELKAEQESEQDLNVLPSLKVSDIAFEEEKFFSERDEIDGQEVFFFDKPTNGVSHIRIKMDLKDIDSSMVQYLSLLNRFFTQLGTKKNRYDEFSELVRLNIADFSFNVSYNSSYEDKDKMVAFAVLKISCLDSKLEKAVSLVTELLTKPDFGDGEHIANLVRLESSAVSNALVENALGFAIDFGLASGCVAQNFNNSLLNVSEFCVFSIFLNFFRIFDFFVESFLV